MNDSNRMAHEVLRPIVDIFGHSRPVVDCTLNPLAAHGRGCESMRKTMQAISAARRISILYSSTYSMRTKYQYWFSSRQTWCQKQSGKRIVLDKFVFFALLALTPHKKRNNNCRLPSYSINSRNGLIPKENALPMTPMHVSHLQVEKNKSWEKKYRKHKNKPWIKNRKKTGAQQFSELNILCFGCK